MRNKIYFLVLLNFFIFISCSDNEENAKFENQVSILNTKYEFINYSRNNTIPYLFGISESIQSNNLFVSDSDFKNILEEISVKYKLEISKNTFMLTFYGNNLDIEGINDYNGISFINYGIDDYFQEIYNIKNEKITKNRNYSKSYPILLTQHFGYMSKVINKSNNCYFNIINKDNNSVSKFKKNKINLNKMTILYPEVSSSIFSRASRVSHSCNECAGNDGFCAFDEEIRDIACMGSTYLDDGGVEEGEEPICGRRQLKSDNVDIKGLNSMYYIKYFILNNSIKGKEYINIYYRLSEIFAEKNLFNTNNQELTNLINFIENKAILFVFSDSSTIILNNSDSIYIKSLIDKYRLYDNSLEYQNIFNKFDLDLQSFKNKSKSELISLISDN